MDKKIAEELLAMSMDCSRDTNESIKRVMERCDEGTFKIYRGHGGRIMGYLFTEVIASIQSEHRSRRRISSRCRSSSDRG